MDTHLALNRQIRVRTYVYAKEYQWNKEISAISDISKFILNISSEPHSLFKWESCLVNLNDGLQMVFIYITKMQL